MLAQGDHFEDQLSYNKAQKEKRKGFCSGDFMRRDEYTKTVRVEQYREQLKQERKYARAQPSTYTGSRGTEGELRELVVLIRVTQRFAELHW